MTSMVGPASDAVSFGPFTLVTSERLLRKGNAHVELGGRALDILIVLVSRRNEPVSKRDLLAQVWPDAAAEEGSLRFHMAGLRKALGDGKDGARYIATLAGRGYCFVAPISRTNGPGASTPAMVTNFPQANLPGRLVRMVGRTDDVRALSTQLLTRHFVTIVGAGGVGKTTVALWVAHTLADAFSGAVLFVDLGMLSDPNLVTAALASMLSLPVHSADPTPSLIAYLRDKRILLVFDTCEHVVEALATLVSQIFVAAPHVHILATSREALQVEGEHVYKLDPLACPPDEPGLTAALAQRFPAIELFMERAAAGGTLLNLEDTDAAIVGGICRKLDGVPLAIELAARRVGVFGLHETVALLDRSLARLWVGPRTAPPRQRTLQATLDWSYGLLSELERIVLRRLAVFVGHFTLDAALAVAISETVDAALVFGAIDSLVAKSMLATRPLGAMMRYRLLDTTRAYVLEFEGDGAELASMAVRHATYYRQWLEQHGAEWPTLATGIERTAHFAAINNVRAALEWCFGRDGDVKTGVGLAAAAAPVLVAMSLLSECLDWSERAVRALDDDARGGFQEMQLQGALGVSLIFTRGAHEAAQVPLMRSLAIAEDRGDIPNQVRQLGSLAALHQRNGEFNIALEYARRCSELARPTGDFAAIALAHSTLGLALHCVGELGAARLEFEAALAHRPSSRRTRAKFFGIESYILANTMLARNLWLQGHPAQAIEQARRTVEEALRTDHSLLISAAFIGVIPVFLLTGDLLSAGDYIDTAIPHAETHSFGPYLWVGRGFKGEIAIRQGDAAGGVETLKSALRKLHEARYELFTTPLNISLIQGLATLGQFDDGIALADETVRQVELNGRYGNMAEALRVKGGLLLLMGQPGSEAEMCFAQSLEVSRRQGARGWELRTAIDLASLWATQGRSDDARTLLRPVFEQFVDGFATADLQSAERLLARLS